MPSTHFREEKMYKSRTPTFRGASRAIIAAGPLFVALSLAALLYMQLPRAISVEPAAIIATPFILLFAFIFGPFIACLPIAIGTCAMHGLSQHIPLLACRPAWAAMGLAIGTGVAHASGVLADSGAIAFALIATCGVSGWLCHSRTLD